MDRTSSKKTRRSRGRTLLVGTPTPFISAPLFNNNPASATHKNPQKAKDYVNQKTQSIKLKKFMKLYYYQYSSTPLDFFGVVTLNPASSTRKDQRCIVEPAHPSPQQAKLKHRRTASVSRIAKAKKAKSDKKAKTAKSFGRRRQERARRHAQPRIVGAERSTLHRQHHSPNVATS